jgi:hypothetical protein
VHAQSLPHPDVRIYLAAELEPDRSLTLAERLEELDLSESQAAAVLAVVEREIETQAFHHAAGVLRKIFVLMSGKNSTCAALAHGLGLHNETPLSELAGALNCSKQALQNLQRVLLPVLPFAPADTKRLPHVHVRPTAPGEWLSVVEARRVSGRSSAKIAEAATAGEVVREVVKGQAFYREDTVMAWSEGIAQTEAQARLTKCARLKPCHSPRQTTAPAQDKPVPPISLSLSAPAA